MRAQDVSALRNPARELGVVGGDRLLEVPLPELEQAEGTLMRRLGVCAPDRDVARLAHFGLHALQHRGQESAGIAVSDGNHLTVLREMGLVAQVFSEQKPAAFAASWRSGTPATRPPARPSGRTRSRSSSTDERTVALGHNGNLVNAGELRDELAADGEARVELDTELIAALIAGDLAPLADAVANAMARSRAPTGDRARRGKLIAFRDPHGFQPLALGRLSDGWVVASETCALDLVGAEFERELGRGELVVADEDGLEARQAVPTAEGALCIFEFFYLARPDTRLEGVEVHAARVRMGERLAERRRSPTSSCPSPTRDAGGDRLLRATGIPFSEGLIKNRYVGRTFIQPDQSCASRIRLKFQPTRRGGGQAGGDRRRLDRARNTTRQIVAMLFDAGATEARADLFAAGDRTVLLRHRPRDESELIAAHRSVEEVRDSIGATSLAASRSPASRRRPAGLPRRCAARA